MLGVQESVDPVRKLLLDPGDVADSLSVELLRFLRVCHGNAGLVLGGAVVVKVIKIISRNLDQIILAPFL